MSKANRIACFHKPGKCFQKKLPSETPTSARDGGKALSLGLNM